jgi:hypothetical protein
LIKIQFLHIKIKIYYKKKLNTIVNKNEKNTQIKIIKISLNERSIDKLFWFFKFNPNKTLNQDLLKPIKPKKFETSNKIMDVNGAHSSNPE